MNEIISQEDQDHANAMVAAISEKIADAINGEHMMALVPALFFHLAGVLAHLPISAEERREACEYAIHDLRVNFEDMLTKQGEGRH